MGPDGAEFATSVVDDATPEDVAALYRWAGLTGATYRDYSAERREQRARMRYRAAKRQLEEALQAKAGGPAAAGVEQARQSEAAARAALRAIEEEREIAEARESARRKQHAFEEAERVLRERTAAVSREGKSGKRRATVEREDSVKRAAELISEIGTPRIVEDAAERALAAIRPAWLEAGAEVRRDEDTVPEYSARERTELAQPISGTKTLLDSREQVALRWPALQALAQELRMARATARISRRRGPVIAVVSVAGGSGVTTLAAVLARALAKEGERVLLVDTAARGLLPLYFGLGRLEPGEMRAAARREGASGAVSVLALDVSAGGEDEAEPKRSQEAAMERLLTHAQECDRMVLDIAPGAEWMVRGLAALRPMVLAPVAPELNCVGGLPAMETKFAGIADDEGRALLPFYALNRFDAGLPLHLDIREVLRRELDERLLAVAVRRSPAVGEALAEGKTVLEYAPDAPVARDCADVARWLKETAPASAETIAEFARGAQ